MKNRVIAVCGPTASGKSALAIQLALKLNGEIVSCDSMQIYRGMDIGTATPSKEEMMGIPHHMMSVIDPSIDYSCADYVKDATAVTDDIIKRGKLPIICGGTGLYMDSLIRGLEFSPDIPENIREELQILSSEELFKMLSEVDPVSAEKIPIGNRRRLIRAIEIYRGTGVPKSEWDRRSALAEPHYDAVKIGLNFLSRELLYSRINKRVDIMLEQGLVEEVKSLGNDLSATASQAIGYKEIAEWLQEKCSYGEAVEAIKQNSRNYAKRQLTWFKRDSKINWFYPDSETEPCKTVENIADSVSDLFYC